ncbi:MAG: S-ribosylhomocysteine lyase [Clostridia bacterium]|nr:S-ribosylhomocysteine lyase [Clostridia bacterium]
MKKITSFTVDHTKITPNIYVSRVDGDVTTYDMRTRRPNMGDYMDNLTMHSLEHMFATYVRSSVLADDVIYFGPMGCQTGFYLLVRNADNGNILSVVKDVLRSIIAHDGAMFGESEIECGNYRNLSVESAKAEAERYLRDLEAADVTFSYPA